MRLLKKQVTVANVLSCLALFLALGGVAYAAKTSLAKNSVKTKNIANGAVTTAKLRNGAVTNGKLRNGAVTGSKIAPGTIGTDQLANGSVRSGQLGGGVVTEAKIKNAAVSESKLANGAVSSGKLATSLLGQLVRNVTYVNKLSNEDSEDAKTVTAECPTGKEAIGGGARVNGELNEVALTGSNPFSAPNGARTGWSAYARESTATAQNWSIEAFAICAEL